LGRSAIDSSSQVVVPAKCDGCRSNNMNDRRRLPKILDLINGDVLPCLWTFEGGLPWNHCSNLPLRDYWSSHHSRT